ncbi:MAG: pentapeptide repeat-containing protein [Planctomycetaceae bacterium]
MSQEDKTYHRILITVILVFVIIEHPDPFFSSQFRSYIYEQLNDWLLIHKSFLARFTLWSLIICWVYFCFVHGKVKYLYQSIWKSRWLWILLVGGLEFFLLFSYRDAIRNYFLIENTNLVWLGPILTMLVASPIAFIIWIFRNNDKRTSLMQTEESIRLLEFHKIEEWAAATVNESALNLNNIDNKDEMLGILKEQTLQIAAIYQLVPYLKGEYGERFVRPSMEIYRALLTLWDFSKEDKKLLDGEDKVQISEILVNKIIPLHIDSLHTIFQEETEFFRLFHLKDICNKNDWIPLKRTNLAKINLYNKNLQYIRLPDCNLSGAILSKSNFSDADLVEANFVSATLIETKFKRTKLSFAKFKYVNMRKAFFEEIIFNSASFESADLSHTKFEDVDFRKALFKNTKESDASIDIELSTTVSQFLPILLHMTKADFSHSNLQYAEFYKCQFTNTLLSNVILHKAEFIRPIFSLKDKERIDQLINEFGIKIHEAEFESDD